MLRGNAIIGQAGGPTPVTNSCLVGVIEGVRKSPQIFNLYGMSYGFEGLMQERLIDLGKQPQRIINGLRQTPSSALGSSRRRLQDYDFPKILEVFQKYNIRYVFLTGGNDTMDTINRVEKYCRQANYDLIGIGIPKSVDNDLYGTDHTPGFASAARTNILNVMQAGRLAKDMKQVDQFVIYQTIGREAGWLGAATALAKRKEGDGPHLIYVPEHPFHKEQFLTEVEACIKHHGWVSVVCGEGLKYEDGTPVSASQMVDPFDNIEFGATGGTSVGMNLHRMITDEFGLRGEFQIPESLIMCAKDREVRTDAEEAYQCGLEAVKLAKRGESGYMVSINRMSDYPYYVEYGKVPLDEVALRIKPMSKDYFNNAGNFISETFYDYIRPLIGELPQFVELEPLFVTEVPQR